MYTCVAWIKQGVSKEIPDKVQLSEEEVKELIEDVKEKIDEYEGSSAATEKIKMKQEDSETEDESEDEEAIKLYDLDNYDNDDGDSIGQCLSGLAMYATPNEDPYITLKNPDRVEEDDFIIKPSDNLVIAGKLEDDYCCAEIYVYNEEEGSFYVHHDILLESFPLAMEWLSYDSLENTVQGNLVAIGTMEPQIQIWDLDIVDIVNPQVVLGKGRKAKSKKKKHQQTSSDCAGHEDAVLTLAWNANLKNILASGSADSTVFLWDLQHSKAVHSLRHHKGKVQDISWHPYEAQSLLSCSTDRTVCALDCRASESNSKSWKFTSEIEKCLWNSFSPYHFMVASEKGELHYCDIRSDTPVYNMAAHSNSVTGMAFSSKIPGCFVSVSSDKTLKVFSIEADSPKFISTRPMSMGRLHDVRSCPDHPFTFAVVGEKDSPRIFNVLETSEGNEYFSRKRPVQAVEVKKAEVEEEEASAMECEPAVTAMASLNIRQEIPGPSRQQNILKKKKNKKKK